LPQQNENNRLARAEPSSNLSRKARRSFIATGEGTDRNKEARQKKKEGGKIGSTDLCSFNAYYSGLRFFPARLI
jgi:hypothetical protein